MTRFALRQALRAIVVTLTTAAAMATTGCVKVTDNSTQIAPEAQALADRAAIENLYADYYGNFGGNDEDFAKYYAADGVLDVNGQVASGAAAITAMYKSTSGGEDTPKASKDPKAPPPSRFHMMYTNLKIEVHGNSAHAELFWDSLAAPSVIGETRVTEFGREKTEWVKQDGRWLMKHREITSYGGMSKNLLDSYKVR
jgi:hypothetical protein